MIDAFPSYFHSNISLFVLIIVLLVSAITGYYLYRKTIPPVNNTWRIILAILRSLSIAGILIILFAPELTMIWYQDKQKNIVLAIDQSASMGIEEAGERRFARANRFASEFEQMNFDKANIKRFTFNSDTLNNLFSEMDTTFGGTDYSRAIASIVNNGKPVDEIILFTDGNLTMGNDPLYMSLSTVPRISTIGYGDTLALTDLLILNVKSNEIIYEGKPTQIQVEFVYKGEAGKSTTLSIKQDGKVISAENIILNNTESIMSRTIEFVPVKTGTNRYELELSKIENEKNIGNNRYIKTLNVRKGKIRTGLIASKIDFDTKFLISLLGQNDEIEFNSTVISLNKPPLQKQIPNIINTSDVVILYNFPNDPKKWQELNGLIEQKKPVLIIVNDPVSPEITKFINQILPVSNITNSGQSLQTQVSRTTFGKNFPQINVFASESQNSIFWIKCPPIKVPYSLVKYDPAAKVILESNTIHEESKKKLPILFSYRKPGTKGMLLLGSGFWKWHFALAEDNEYHFGWTQVLKNLIRWLGSGSNDKNVILSAGKKTFELGENISLNTQVYDGSLIPVSDASVRVQISGPGGKFELFGDNYGGGTYGGRFMAFTEGEYYIKSTAFKNDVRIGSDSIKVVVIPVNREYMFTNQNYIFLRQLSEKFKGSYYHEDNATQILNDLDLKPRRERLEDTIELWHKMTILILILIFMAAEWFIRKRLGLA